MNAEAQPNEFRATLILERYQADQNTQQFANEDDRATIVLDRLIEEQQFDAAINFLSYWLPPQYLVWWGCLCIWEVEREINSPEIEGALQGLITWLQTPSEPHRTALFEIDKQVPQDHPISFLCKAALFSGGSMTTADLPPVPPPKYLYSKLGGGSVLLVAARGKPEDYVTNRNQIMRLGKEVLHGMNLWYRREHRSA